MSFTDDRDFEETLISEATAEVEAAAADDSAVWSATLTVGESSGIVGYWNGLCGALKPRRFKLDGDNYRVAVLAEVSGSGFFFEVDQPIPGGFSLRVGEVTFESSDAEQHGGSSSGLYQWTGQPTGLTDGSTWRSA